MKAEMTETEAVITAAEFAEYALDAKEVANATVRENADGSWRIEFTSDDVVAISPSGECRMIRN